MDFVKSLLGKKVRVDLIDGRSLIGFFTCTDKDCNIVLAQAMEYFDEKLGPRPIGMIMVSKNSLTKIYIEKAGQNKSLYPSSNIPDSDLPLRADALD